MRFALLSLTLVGCVHVPPGPCEGPPGELKPEDLAPIVEAVERAHLVLSKPHEKQLPLTRAALSSEGHRVLWGVCTQLNESCKSATEGRCLDHTTSVRMKDGQRPEPLRPPRPRSPPPGQLDQLVASAWAVGLVSLFLPMWWQSTGTAPSGPSLSEPDASEVAAWEAVAAEQRASECRLYLGAPDDIDVTLSLDFPRAKHTCRVWLTMRSVWLDRVLTGDDIKHVACFSMP